MILYHYFARFVLCNCKFSVNSFRGHFRFLHFSGTFSFYAFYFLSSLFEPVQTCFRIFCSFYTLSPVFCLQLRVNLARNYAIICCVTKYNLFQIYLNKWTPWEEATPRGKLSKSTNNWLLHNKEESRVQSRGWSGFPPHTGDWSHFISKNSVAAFSAWNIIALRDTVCVVC